MVSLRYYTKQIQHNFFLSGLGNQRSKDAAKCLSTNNQEQEMKKLHCKQKLVLGNELPLLTKQTQLPIKNK